MTPREIATQYEAKIFETPEAAQAAGFALTETMRPRNIWNKASATHALLLPLLERKRRGEIAEVGVVLDNWSVTGCYRAGEQDNAGNGSRETG